MATNNRFVVSYNGLTGVYYPSQTGLVDIRTGTPYVGGGLYLGAVTELTMKEALSLSAQAPSSPPIYGGRYRFIAIDPGATAANLGFAKLVGWQPGIAVQDVAILTAGSGQTQGSYTATASAGGAVIGYTINASGALASAWVIQGGTYASNASLPTFTIAAGGTPGTVAALMDLSPNRVTSMDIASTAGLLVRGVLLGGPPTAADLANPAYAWMVENGEAPVTGNATIGSGAAIGNWVNSITSTPDGSVNAASANVFNSGTVGYALDLPRASSRFRVQLTLPNFGG
jgi:hypothetical protein